MSSKKGQRLQLYSLLQKMPMLNKKILIVEDEPIIALELSERLQQYGYLIAGIAPTGKDAQKKFQITNPDLILLDISLKGEMNGIEFAEILRKTSDIPIIYVTAFSDQPTLARAKLTQPSGFLLKPFNQRELETTIDISLYKYEMEKKIKENERWLNATFNGINDGIITTDKDGLINYVNLAAEHILVLRKKDILNKDFRSIIKIYSPLNSEEQIDPIKSSLELKIGTEVFQENYLLNNNNEQLIIEHKITILRDEYGNIAGFVFVFRDITQKKKIELELKRSDERYKSVIEQISDGIILYDFNTHKVLETNKAYRDLTGYTEEELLSKITEDLVYQEDVPSAYHAKQLRENNNYFIGERKHIKKDGSIINVEVSSNLFEIGGLEILVVVVRDITERKKSEEALRTSEEKLRSLFDTMAQGIINQDSEGNIISANQAACKILGIKIDKLIGTLIFDPYWALIHEDGTPFKDDEHPAMIALQTGKEVSGVTMGIKNRIENKYRWIVLSAIPHTIPGEKHPSSVFITFTDITDLKNTQDELKKYGEELKHVIATKDKFFSIVAHDLKSPFLGLLGFTTALTEDFDQFELEQIKRYIGNISKATRNIYSLIQNLLEWSRLQTNKLELCIMEIGLHQIADYSINLLMTNASNKSIIIDNQISETDSVIADERVMDSVFSNLITNAIKFSKRGGIIKLTSTRIDGFIEVCIEDNGVGMDSEKIKDLFKLDVTVTSRGTDGEAGTGLGLVLCQEMLEKLGGKIWVESELGEGSKFFFKLPKA